MLGDRVGDSASYLLAHTSPVNGSLAALAKKCAAKAKCMQSQQLRTQFFFSALGPVSSVLCQLPCSLNK